MRERSAPNPGKRNAGHLSPSRGYTSLRVFVPKLIRNERFFPRSRKPPSRAASLPSTDNISFDKKKRTGFVSFPVSSFSRGMHHKIYWTPEMESAFIDLVAGQPRIWDPRNKDYIRRSARNEAFMEVGAELKERWPEHAQLFTHENMTNKFAMLRSCFRREWKTAQKMRGSDYVPKWEHYARLSFLEKVPARGAKNRNSGVTPMDISDQSDDSDATSPDTEELDCGGRPSTSGPKFQLNLRPFLAEDGSGHARLKQYQSSDDSSSNEDFPPSASSHRFRDILPADHLSAADIQRKNALDLAFCRYLNTMLSPIPDCLQKELAKIKITETILKLKFPQA